MVDLWQDDVKRYRRAIAVELLHNKVELPPSKEREDDGSRLVAQPENGQLSQTQ